MPYRTFLTVRHLTAIIVLILEQEFEMTRKFKGFTLIELMMAVAVIGILAAIAYPSYTEYVMKARRADAKAGLLSLQLAQEKYRANCVQYATGLHATTYSCGGGSFNLVHVNSSPDGHYALSIVSASATAYTLRATRQVGGAQANDKCGNFEIVFADGLVTKQLQTGSYSTGYNPDTCW